MFAQKTTSQTAIERRDRSHPPLPERLRTIVYLVVPLICLLSWLLPGQSLPAQAETALAGNLAFVSPVGPSHIPGRTAVLTETTTFGGQIADAESGQVITTALVNLYRVPGARPDAPSQPGDCPTVETRPASSGGPFGPWGDLPGATLKPEEWVDPAASQISGTAVISPAVNPQAPDPDGGYGWAVVAGCWYIEVSAAGYQSLVSPLIGGPPAATDLNIALQPVEASPARLYLPLVVR